jgi:hypothetical protein
MRPHAALALLLSPAKLTLAVDAPVNLTLKNAGCGPHDPVIEGIDGAYHAIGAGAPAAHNDNGMSGDVTVA